MMLIVFVVFVFMVSLSVSAYQEYKDREFGDLALSLICALICFVIIILLSIGEVYGGVSW